MRKLWKRFRWRDVFFTLLIVKLISWLSKCYGKPGRYHNRKVEHVDANFIHDEVIVMKKDGVPEIDFENWKNTYKELYQVESTSVCGYCDSTIERWKGDNVSTFIQDKVASGGISPGSGGGPASGGEDEVAYFTYNLVIDLPEPKPDKCALEEYGSGRRVTVEPQNTLQEPPLVIAVFDTGLLDSIKTMYTRSMAESCIDNGKEGWNFAYGNLDTTDDHKGEHGSVVSAFIINQAQRFHKRMINILPVKIHDSEGKSDLFSVLCGFAYAANCGARIINASFGFYAKQNSGPPALLKVFVQKHLTGNNILLIAAAGNINYQEDRQFRGYKKSNPRNLDEHPFYPACLSKDFENVLAVTTVLVNEEEADVCPTQNFSDHVVDIGVNCDMVADDGDFKFFRPFNNNAGDPVLITGSSFATPVVTGIIAQHYSELISVMPGNKINKKLLIEKLKSLKLVGENEGLASLVIKGNYCLKMGQV